MFLKLIVFASLSLSTTSCIAATQSPTPTVSAQSTTPAPVSAPQSPTASKDVSVDSSKQSMKRRTVGDYFLEIPEQYLRFIQSQPISSQQRQQLLAQAKQGQSGNIYDPNNGYLQIRVMSDLCSSYTVAIFSRPSASPLVALNVSCAAGDQVNILDPDQNWSDVTKTVFPGDLSPNPNLDDVPPEVKLPQFGRTIEVKRQRRNQTAIARYRFDGQRFVPE